MEQFQPLNGDGENYTTALQIDSPEISSRFTILTEEELISHLKDLTKRIGRITDAAERLEISPQFLGQVLAGKKKLGKKLLDKLGIETVYRVEGM